MTRQKTEVKQRLEQHEDAIDENGKLVAQTGNKYTLSKKLRSLVDENYKLKIQIYTNKSIFDPQDFVLKQQKAAIEQLRPTIGAMRDRVHEVEIVANQILAKGTKKDLRS
ncbi:hypothetical protein FACUT_3636 [Fusarium acutatum]|uniref:Uncharacterized protein n=1 Tax=Fusarium acutatum TaxID=78861 RepID=A0A8H4JZN5_9HYPO|nr:hypothetical protein FACUT_3636 [Fusarium acutatum]